MPVYVYKCLNCEHQFEARQSFTDKPLRDCPQCEGQIKRVINNVGIVFKGSGFYVTDNRNGRSNIATTGVNKKETEKSDSGVESSKDVSTESASDSKESGTSAAASPG